MPEELFVVARLTENGGSRSLFLSKGDAVEYAEQTAADPNVEEVEVRAYRTLDLINDALDELDDASREDPDIENGELVKFFQ